MKKITKTAMTFNILVKEIEDLYVAHCLELDIVATSENSEQVEKDIIDLILAQVDYAFSNNNLAYLYRPAPPELWEEFHACKAVIEEKKIKLESTFRKSQRFVPPSILARTCNLGQFCHA